MAVRRKRQETVLHIGRQHAEIHLNVVRIVEAVQERLGTEQLDIGFELSNIAVADAADKRLDGLHADAHRFLHPLGLIAEQELDDVELFRQGTLRQRLDGNDVRNAPHKGLGQGGIRVLRGRPHDEHLGAAAAGSFPQTVEGSRVHEVEDHLLPFRRKTMDLIEEQDAPVRLLHQTRLGRVRPREGALDMAEDMGDEQLWIVVVIRTVEGDEGRILREAVHDLAVLEHHMGKECLAHARLPDNQGVQPIRRVKDGSLRLLHLHLEAGLRADEPLEGLGLPAAGILDTLLYCTELQGPRPQIGSPKILQRLPVKIAHRPPQDLHDAVLPMQHVQFHGDIVPQDVKGLRNLLRIQPHLPLKLLLLVLARLLPNVFKNPLNPLQKCIPPSDTLLILPYSVSKRKDIFKVASCYSALTKEPSWRA